MTAFYDIDFYGFVSPNPTLVPKYFAIVYPLSFTVWKIAIALLILIPIALIIVARIEQSIIDVRLNDWTSYAKSLWFCYGTFIGESISGYGKLFYAHSLKYIQNDKSKNGYFKLLTLLQIVSCNMAHILSHINFKLCWESESFIDQSFVLQVN